jgi:cholesterol transport system auxiliary component
MKKSRLAVTLIVVVMSQLAGGCANVLDSDREPIRVYTLAPPGAAATHDADAVTVGLARVLSAPGLDTDRILLRREPLRLDYYAGARWAATAPVLVGDYLAAVLLADGTSLRLAGARETPAYELGIEIRAFEADYVNGEPPVVRVDFVAVLRDERERRRVMLVRRSASRPAANNTLGAVARAFDAAMEKVASELLSDIEKAVAGEGG